MGQALEQQHQPGAFGTSTGGALGGGASKFGQQPGAAGAFDQTPGTPGDTQLYYASLNGHLEVVRVLLDAKAEVNKVSSIGQTTLSQAISSNHPEIAALLRDAGAHE